MPSKNLTELVSQLSSDEQAAVRQFIEFIRGRTRASESSPFLNAIDEFMAEHPELLRSLALRASDEALSDTLTEWASPVLVLHSYLLGKFLHFQKLVPC